jgi:hypothetical protein
MSLDAAARAGALPEEAMPTGQEHFQFPSTLHMHGGGTPRPSRAPGARRYSAALLALAHLQAERAAPAWPVLPGPRGGGGSGGGGGGGGGAVDLGHALVGFLERFGRQFDYERQAVRRDMLWATAGRVWEVLYPSVQTSMRAFSVMLLPFEWYSQESATDAQYIIVASLHGRMEAACEAARVQGAPVSVQGVP